MLLRLILLFTLLPIAELALLLWLGARIGLLPTLALMIVTGVVGATLARLQGLATLARFQKAVAAGRLPGTELVEGLLLLVAGAVLLTPGVLTDAAGFLLLVPPVRRGVARGVEGWARRRVVVRTPGTGPAPPRSGDTGRDTGAGDVIDADYEVIEK